MGSDRIFSKLLSMFRRDPYPKPISPEEENQRERDVEEYLEGFDE